MLGFSKSSLFPRNTKTDTAMFNNKKKTNGDRRGVATVEFAVLLPVMVIILMGTIECTSMIFLQQSLEIVCYETVRTAARPQTVNGDANARADELIADRGLVGCTVTLTDTLGATPPNVVDLSTMTRGDAILVSATAGTSENAFFPVTFFPDTLTAEAVMVKQ